MYTIDGNTYQSPNYNERELAGAPAQIQMLLIHATADSNRDRTAKWLCNVNPIDPETGKVNKDLRVSTHYVIGDENDVDASGKVRIFQLVDDRYNAWHAGESAWGSWRPSVNPVSIGIELVNSNNGRDPYGAAQIDALTWLVEWKARQYGVTLDHVLRHSDVAPKRKNDPLGFPWETWKERLTIDQSNGLWALWGDRFPLYDDQKGWSIQQAWLKHAERLGMARSWEDYPSDWSVRHFEHGLIMYRAGKTKVVFSDDI